MANISAILEGLNSEQQDAVSCLDGPVLIVAGAGSGKTRVLTSRIAYLLEKGGDPGRVMALTFTKKAATEMKERIAAMVGERKARRLYMGTFHSIFIRFLREYAQDLGYPSSFTIYDQSDSVSAVKACIKELNLDDKVYKPKEVQGRISMAKNNLVTPDAYRANADVMMKDLHAKRPRLHEIYALYCTKCKQAGVMDFDDILLNMNILLARFPAHCLEIAGRFDHILVDEYQDTNYAQYIILRRLTRNEKTNPKGHDNICVVGDDSQSIYAFRGAKIENILNFKRDYPGCKVFRLERNYRSTQNIVNAANSLIAKNEGRIPKKCYAVGEEGEKLHLIRAYTESEEALLIVSKIIARMQEERAQYQDFAILYRTNSQSRALEEALRKRNLPYRIYSGNAFFDRAEVKDMMAYFKLAVNVNDDESFKRIVNKPARGIGGTTTTALEAAARSFGTSLFKAVYHDGLDAFGLKNAAVEHLKAFCTMIDAAAQRVKTDPADVLARRLADQSALLASFKSDTSIEGQARAANVEELLNSVAVFVEDRREEIREEMLADENVTEVSDEDLPVVTLDVFLEDISLLSNVDLSEDEEKDASNKITLMTVHSAKGLEFPYVFVAGMEENLFPSGGMMLGPAELEEERRLFYVAITRAKKTVDLSYAQTRMRNGKHESNAPSRFLREIDAQYVANPLRRREEEDEDDDAPAFGGGFKGFGGYGYRTKAKPVGSSPWGASGEARTERRPASVMPVRPTAAPSARPTAAPSARPLPPKEENFVPDSPDKFRAGQTITHDRFGRGKILEINGATVLESKARIVFEKYGEKILLLKYAKMRIED